MTPSELVMKGEDNKCENGCSKIGFGYSFHSFHCDLISGNVRVDSP